MNKMYGVLKSVHKILHTIDLNLVLSLRCLSSLSQKELVKIRNIAILAHIDAGKTTTTERLLYYSGRISDMGEVHEGNTVTDFLVQERNRGITISSAFVTFKWANNVINLVDTPGHIDFTMEVEQALKVIDSGIIILDATAGVEAQTVTVWKQTNIQNLPCLVYINKMDRDSANLELCLSSLKQKLSCQPLLLHIPVKINKKFEGVIDLLSLNKIVWTENGKKICSKLLDKSDSQYEEAFEARLNLIDTLSSVDDNLADIILQNDSLEKINKEEIVSAIQRAVLNLKGVPVICGSSYKNIGVETLLNAIVDYLPSPVNSPSSSIYLNEKGTLARSFKIIHDKQRGPLTFLRIYTGELYKGQKMYNVSNKNSENVGRILVPFADELKEIPSAEAGHFVAVTGFKDTLTGDMICGSQTEFKKMEETLIKKLKLSKVDAEMQLNFSQRIPDPVFFCAVETHSQAYQPQLEKALSEMTKEDPSLRVRYDEETSQTILSGMGELHLEIVKDRIKTNYNLDVDLGPMQIVYKEELCSVEKSTHILKSSLGSREQSITLTLSLKPGSRKELLHLDMSGDSGPNLAHLSPKVISILNRGITSALKRGPLFSSEVINVHAILHWFEAHRQTPEPLIAAAASQCAQKILQSAETKLLEPLMLINISLPNKYSSLVVADLTRRRGILAKIDEKGEYKEIESQVPLSELLGYAKELRTMTSGTANLSMSFLCYSEMSNEEFERLQNSVSS